MADPFCRYAATGRGGGCTRLTTHTTASVACQARFLIPRMIHGSPLVSRISRRRTGRSNHPCRSVSRTWEGRWIIAELVIAAMVEATMDVRLLLMPALIAVPAALIFGVTWGANTLAQRAAHRVATRPRFTPEERSHLRALRARYRRQAERD